MELKGIKNIIFDLGGVLLNLDFNKTKSAFINLGLKDFDEYYTKAKQSGLFDLFETGSISELEFCSHLKSINKMDVSDDKIIEAWNAMLLNFPTSRKELLLLLKNQFAIVLLSNTNETHIRAFTDIIQQDIGVESLSPLFNEVYYSNEIGLRKPNRNIFEYVLAQNNFIASETLFLDDSIQHIEGAREVGIQAYHINDQTVEELFRNFLT